MTQFSKILVLVCFLTVSYHPAWADDIAVSEDSAAAISGVTPKRIRGGLQFSIPEDWPIEKRGGAIGPIPIEEYLVLKFDKMEQRIRALEEKVSQLAPQAPAVKEGSAKGFFKSSMETEEPIPPEGGLGEKGSV